jgi:hypothetical protein
MKELGIRGSGSDESPSPIYQNMDPEILKELQRQDKESALIKQAEKQIGWLLAG